ncbi:ribonuclease H-like domain-containing protein, partial [Tanacetum coccineum]
MNSKAQEISGKNDKSSFKKVEIAQDSSAKRAGDKLESDKSKKQKTNENKEVEVDNEAELKKHMVTVKDDDITINAIPLATKPPVIVAYKLIREGIMGHYQLIRADGSFKRYSSMIRMLQGGSTVVILTYVLREQKELSTTTYVTFAPVACMTWELADSGNDFLTSIINGADVVPTFSAALVDDLRAEVTTSAWLNDLRTPINHTRILRTVYRSASALGSRLPSIASAKAKVVGAGGILHPVSSGTQFCRRPTAKGVELYVVNSHTGNHPEDGFTPLETIQRFRGNDESKKIQKYILKEQFESLSVSNSEGLHKGYDRFQSLLSQLKIHGVGVSTEDANQKFLRSLPASLSQVSFIMRTKPGVDSLSFDDLYNNLRVFEHDVKGFNGSSSSTQNVAFVSSSTSSTNDVSTAYGVSTSSGHNSQKEVASSYTDELMYSFFANQSIGPQLDHEDLEQKFYKKTGRKLQFDAKEPVGFDKTKVECFNCHNTGHFARECRSKGNQESRRRDAGNTGYKAKDNGRRPGKQEEPKALVTLDGDGVDWTGHAEDEQENFALMAYSNSGSDTEKLLAEAVKEKEELKTKLENFQSSSKGLSKLLNSQMSAKDKSGLGYGDQIHEGVLRYEKEVLESVFDSRSSDVEDSPVYDRFVKVEGMHVVPPLMIGIYMPPKSDFGIDESKFTYGPKQSKTSESDAKTNDFASCKSNSSVETLESVPKTAINKPKAVSEPKVWSNAPIIEEYESDSDDEYVIKPLKEQERPSFAFVNTVKHVKTPRETFKKQNTCSLSPKADKRDCNGLMSKKLGLGYRFTRKACFVCGSFGHLIRDYDFHEKKMAIQVKLNKQKGKGTGQGALKNKGIVDSGCSRHMAGNKAYLVEYQDYNSGLVAFGELQHFNLFYVSQMCDKKNKNIVPTGDLACLIAKATVDEPNKWHRRLERKATQGLLFSWVFFLRTKDETSGIIKEFIRQIENQLNQKVKTIRCDNGSKFKNRDIIEFYGSKEIKREYSNARTLQQNGVAKRKNMTLIEAAITMLANLFLPNTFWAEVVSTACYVLNRILVTKPQNKTPYELLT